MPIRSAGGGAHVEFAMCLFGGVSEADENPDGPVSGRHHVQVCRRARDCRQNQMLINGVDVILDRGEVNGGSLSLTVSPRKDGTAEPTSRRVQNALGDIAVRHGVRTQQRGCPEVVTKWLLV